MNKLAFFDLDMTLHDTHCTSLYLNFLTEKEIVHPKFMEQINIRGKKFSKGDIDYNKFSEEILVLFCKSLENHSKSELHEQSSSFNDQINFYPYVKPLMHFLRAKGFKIIIVSAAERLPAEIITKNIHYDELIVTEAEMDGDRYTGNMKKFINGATKLQAIEEIISANQPTITIGFGDSQGDFEMLDRVDLAFLVNTKYPEAVAYARERNWQITNHARPMIKAISSHLQEIDGG